MEYNELKSMSNEELIKKYNTLKEDILYMEECLKDKSVSYEQKSEFVNDDIPYAMENIEKIEEVLNARKVNK